ncbi:unnamed protein product [Closterium sp. NIES-64]|nr:unnamed protein product [Closterium sp. NIES-64]
MDILTRCSPAGSALLLSGPQEARPLALRTATHSFPSQKLPQASRRHVVSAISEGSRKSQYSSSEFAKLPSELQDLSNLVKKLANETTKPPPPRADTARPPVKSPRYSDFANNPENDLSNKPAVAAPDAPSIPGLPASVARQMPWLAAAKAQPAQDAESDLEGLIPKARSSPSMATPDDRTVVPRTEVIAMRSRLNKKLSESNTYNRFLQREVQYREQALSDSKALMIALAAEMRELSEVAEEIVKTDGLPVTRKINGRYLPSHLSNRLEELYSDLRQQLEGIEKLRLREVPLVWFGMAEDVKVMGSFDGWTYGEQMSPETTGTMTRFTTVLKLRPGRYEIKFLVDGEWRVATEWPTVGHGMLENNILTVE